LGSETSGIEVIKEYSYLPEVECYPSLLNQVFMNIFNNAIESLEKCYSNQNTPADTNYQRSIIIRTQALSNKILQISIKDSEDIKQQIFVPFFTTKSVGLGIGLGLSVSYQIIVNQHRGNIQCISQAGKGAEFIIEIPFQQ
jgi:signal transduction histidine kinase